jgi:hypothetical protein
MGMRIVFLLAAATAPFVATAICAEEPTAQASAGNLLTQVKWLRLEVVGGRIVVKSDRCPHSRHVVEAAPAEGSRQTLSLESRTRDLILRYEERSPTANMLLEINDRGQLTIKLTAEDSPVAEVLYVQPPTGQVALTIAGKTTQKAVATDLWQLLIVEREQCCEHLLPILHHLRADWALEQQLNDVEAALIARAGSDVLAQQRNWRALVEELGSSNFAARQAADLALRTGGQGLLATLRQLDQRELDGEQRRRIRAILADLADSGPDSQERIADWLSGDKRVWLALLARGGPAERVAAVEHLRKLYRRPISFDPHAGQDQRQAQLAELTAKLADR